MKSSFKRGDGKVPDMVKVRFNGKDLWDKTDFLAFYEKTIAEMKHDLGFVAPHTELVPNEPVEQIDSKLPWADADSDDLPF
jgi:hypothetical protein